MQIAQLIASRPSADIVTCHPDMQLREAVALIAQKRIGALPVVDGGQVVGIFSERDVLYRLAAEGEACLSRSVGEVMTAPAISVDPSSSVLQALALMTRRRIRHLPVVDGTAMCGFISIGDLVKSRIDEIESEAEAMREYISMA
ncbi:MAG: CBS domain-containing protein [Sphingomonadales bacterium]|nr:CBS domain-containing protein [Sphingomonadales bacterium]MBD3773637.1 CBS domain-containing protein [Paracoccaceae bacterium]